MRQQPMLARISAFAADKSGASAIEYGIIAGIMAGVVFAMNAQVQAAFEHLSQVLMDTMHP